MDINKIYIPRYKELPKVPLYKDQVITYLQDIARSINITNYNKLITPTMLNNYVKQKVVEPPKDKKYNENHVAYLIVVCILKQVFSLQEICLLIKIQIENCPIELAYDYFCTEIENALNAVFYTRDFSYDNASGTKTLESKMLRSTVMAVAHKVYIENKI